MLLIISISRGSHLYIARREIFRPGSRILIGEKHI